MPGKERVLLNRVRGQLEKEGVFLFFELTPHIVINLEEEEEEEEEEEKEEEEGQFLMYSSVFRLAERPIVLIFFPLSWIIMGLCGG